MALALVERLDSSDAALLDGVEIPSLALPLWKRVIDTIGSAALLLLVLPLMVAASIWVMLDSPGGAFIRQPRVGRGGRIFNCWKFRTMHRGAAALVPILRTQNEAPGPMFKLRNDPRRTRAGKFLRRTSLDELPQLWNVLRGEMSLVGPRPPLASEVAEYSQYELQRLGPNPGMTGLWQVTLRGLNHEFTDLVALDIEYSRTMSLALDVKILLRTIPTVLLGRGSV